jgi:hypothetical protein
MFEWSVCLTIIKLAALWIDKISGWLIEWLIDWEFELSSLKMLALN